MANDGYIQIGVTAMRDRATGEFLPSVPIFIRAEDSAAVGCGDPICDIGKVLAEKIRRCKQERGECGD